MSRKRGLGKGLETLIGKNNMTEPSTNNSQNLSINKLVANPYQPRKKFDDLGMSTLTESIKEHGIIQPLAVRPIQGSDKLYEIIAGERRFRAAKKAGLVTVPVVIHDISDADSAAFALIENLQREDLNVIEKAYGIQRLIEEFALTHEACGKILAQSRSAISNTLRLLDLAPQVQDAVSNKNIDMGHARALLPVEKSTQPLLLKHIRLNGLSVRETEAFVKSHQNDGAEKEKNKPTKKPRIKLIEEELSQLLGIKVTITENTMGKGKMTLSFQNKEMLDKLHRNLCNDNHLE